ATSNEYAPTADVHWRCSSTTSAAIHCWTPAALSWTHRIPSGSDEGKLAGDDSVQISASASDRSVIKAAASSRAAASAAVGLGRTATFTRFDSVAPRSAPTHGRAFVVAWSPCLDHFH